MNKRASLFEKGKKMNLKMNFSYKNLLLVVCLGGFFVIAASGCGQKATSTLQVGVQAPQVTPVVQTSQTGQVTPVVQADTVIAEGRLLPATSTWLSFQTSARIEQVLVKEGEAVKKGQALVQLEGSSRAEAQLTAAQSDLFLALQTLNDTKNSGKLKANSELAVAAAQREYNTALGNYYGRKDPQGSAEQIALYDAKVTILQDKVDTLQERLNGMGEMTDVDVAKAKVIADLNQAKIDLKNLEDVRNYYHNLPDSVDLATLSGKLDLAKAVLADAQRDLDRLADGPSKESLAQLQAIADGAQAKADDAQWAYDQLVLKAPYDGTFVQCDLTVGQFVAAGTPAALVADFSQWKIETTDLDEIEAAKVDTGKPVTITADALPGVEFSGTVDQISQYFTDKNSDILYTATIKLDKTTETKLRWGMTMQVEFQK